MVHCALPIFLLMTGATLLGGWLAWLWARRSIVGNTDEVVHLNNQLALVQEEIERLLEYSSSFHAEKRTMSEEQQSLMDRLQASQNATNRLTKDKAFLMSEFNRVNQELERTKLLQQDVFFDEGMEVTEAEPATDDAQVNQLILEKQLQGLQDDILQWKTKYEALKDSLSKKERKIIALGELEKQDKVKGKKKRWEVKYKQLKLKLVAATKERDTALSQLETMKTANDQLLTELLSSKAIVVPQPELNKSKEEVFDRIKKRKDLLDFHRIGKYNSKQKDDLKKISGVGPFIEKKLNALGIYKFEQLAKLNDDDISEIIKIIEVPSGIIKGADWIEQAKNMK